MARGFVYGFKQINKSRYWENFAKDGRVKNPTLAVKGNPPKVKHICIVCLKNEIRSRSAKYCQPCFDQFNVFPCYSCGQPYKAQSESKNKKCADCYYKERAAAYSKKLNKS